jgi:hypothetical protein
MYPVSEAYKNAISQNERNVRIAGTITLKDNSVIQIDDEDILQGSLYFTEQCVSGEDIEIGNVYASEMGLTLTSPPENPYSLDGARIILNFGIETSEGVWEYVPLGYFYVTEIERKHTAVNLKALDGLILFDVDLSGVISTGTPYALIESCCNKVGITLATSMEEFQDFSNGLTAFTIPSDSKIETCRDLLMWVCQLTGTFARMNRMGQLEVIPIAGGNSVKTISKPERFTSDVSDFEVKVTKVAMKIGEAEYSQGAEGMTMALEENPLLINKEPAEINAALNELLDQVTLAEYVPYSLDFAGDPAIQAGDWVTLADTARLSGGDVTSLVTHTTWRYRGPHNIKAVGKSGLIRGVQAQQSKTVSSIQAIAKAAQDIAQAANQSTQLINDAIGGHVLIRREPGGTNEILIMDNEDPEQATKIWRWNMGGLGYSDNVTGADNPAREYDVAMTMDGAINADFFIGGLLKGGKVHFDLTNGTLLIGNSIEDYNLLFDGNSLKIRLSTGQTIDDKVAELEDSIPYVVQIISTHGLVFKPEDTATTLIARVYRGEDDVTDEIDANYFRWTRVSNDPVDDQRWNDRNASGTKQITITTEDVRQKATFFCDVRSNEE